MLELLAALETAAAGSNGPPPIAVGLSAFGFLMFLLFILLMFGKGREHS